MTSAPIVSMPLKERIICDPVTRFSTMLSFSAMALGLSEFQEAPAATFSSGVPASETVHRQCPVNDVRSPGKRVFPEQIQDAPLRACAIRPHR